ncbi:hypothetical protein, partial [Deinococcus sp. GbtcB9]|uniref:hypothetical protein n=1 Tax=Deinococcus sp. GbtcB9 TaxID=2824754 RepID=UPI001C2FD2F7
PPPTTCIDLPVDARLSPDSYASADGQGDEKARIATYGRHSDSRTLQAISRVVRVLRKKYGPPSPGMQDIRHPAPLLLA